MSDAVLFIELAIAFAVVVTAGVVVLVKLLFHLERWLDRRIEDYVNQPTNKEESP